MSSQINSAALLKLKLQLATKLNEGCREAAKLIKETTPIDTQRLYESTRATEPEINKDSISCKVVAGGLELYGVRREQDIRRPVDYAIFVENKYNYIRNQLDQITEAILDPFQN